MDKKIFDIIPPVSRSEPAAEEVEIKPVIKPEPVVAELEPEEEEEEDIKPPQPKSIRLPKKKAIIIGVLVIILLASAVASYFFLPVVKIEIWLKTNDLNTDQKVQINKEIKTVDALNHLLPGRIIIGEQTFSKEFKATGKAVKEVKAEGIIRIYNDYSTASQTLVATTRFVSDEGKLFRLVEATVVPGQTMEKGKLVPGTIDVLIRADAAGPDYNIGTSTFSIPGFAGTPRYTSFYARSSTAMTGGFKGDSLSVSEADLEKAKKSMIAEAKQKIADVFINRALPGLVLAQEANPITIIDDGTDAKAGQAAETFTYQVKARGRAILLVEEDLKEAGQAYFVAELPEDQKFLSDSIKTNILIEEIDEVLATARLALQISGKVYQDLEIDFIKAQLKGKSIQEVEKSFQELSQVSQARIKIFPSLIKKLPQDDRKIEIKVNFD
ncbi:hypothetical protein L6250_01360 [Candidatus Parcubacteria bacterium]|nr:hypothetical protein [Patescibacteria group bacterium]MCG2688263.1 hypothetical protein [Candidatus Parcubacteria bacterium]